jgi:MinD-like ATPase involved in chromosome partitioning or flagellar assembly
VSLVTIVSAKGSPGTTTIALHLARELAGRLPGPMPGACLVDADRDGGDVALMLGLEPLPGVGTLALAGRHGIDDATLLEHSQRPRSLPRLAVVPGISGRAQSSTLDWLAAPLADVAVGSTMPVVVDAGRASGLHEVPALFHHARHVFVTCRADTASVLHTRSAMVTMAAAGLAPRAVVIGALSGPADELAAALAHPVAAIVGTPHTGLQVQALRQPPARYPAGVLRQMTRPGDTGIARLADVVLDLAADAAEPPTATIEAAPAAVTVAAMRLTRHRGIPS